ncbi:MAG: hypothetical protein EXR80_07380 [Methylococcales bacterium]|nr:hypothetical protein [Methylococcales bacterium]
MSYYPPSLTLSLITSLLLAGCASTRQVAIEYPTANAASDSSSTQSTNMRSFTPLPSFPAIDGDDYYVRLLSEFEFKGENSLKSGCQDRTPSYTKSDLSSALVFNVHNSNLKFNNETAGFLYHAGTGKCNFQFDAKKQMLTPWMRLDAGKDTTIDYSFFSSANSNVDMSSLAGDMSTASNLLALTGVGMGVSLLGQFASQWVGSTPAVATPVPTTGKHSSASHTLPAIVSFSGKTGTLNETSFKVYAVAEGGINILSSETKPLGELKVYPEITASLLLKTSADGTPDARDLSWEEIGYLPIKSASSDVKLIQLLEQSKHPAKPNLKPDWHNYTEVETECHKLKTVLKDLGFNKFDRNAVIYYFLANNNDWKNYNLNPQQLLSNDVAAKTAQSYRDKNFGNCLVNEDYLAMKAMGLTVNVAADWQQIGESSQKKEQRYAGLKSIERQLVSVLKNPNKAEIESQIFPLLSTAKNGAGTVLLQNYLGDFGLEKLLNPAPPTATLSETPAIATTISGEGTIVNAHQLAQVFSGLAINELSCARLIPDQQGNQINNIGILLFSTQDGSPRAKGGVIEFEFSDGKINRIAFQLPSQRDVEQDLVDHPELGACRIDPALLQKLH